MKFKIIDLTPRWPRIALCGRFDTSRFGEHVFARVFEREIQRRLPGATVSLFAPGTEPIAVALDGGFTASPIGEPLEEGIRGLSARFDHVASAGGDAGLDASPDAAVLAAGLFPAEVLRRRLDYLRWMEWYPKVGEPVVLKGGVELLPRVEPIAASLSRVLGGKDIPLVLLETDPGDGDGRFLDALTERLAIPTFRIPPSVSLVDLLAAIGNARAFVGSSPHGRSAAQAFGIPAVGNSEDLEASLSSALAAGRSSGPPPELERSLAARFNGVATAADEGLRRRLASQHGVATTSILIDALRASGRRVEELEDHLAAERLRAAGERIRLMEQVQDCQAETARVEAALRETEERARSAEDEREALRAEYVRFTTSRLYRYSTPLRGIYGGLRRALGLKKGESR